MSGRAWIALGAVLAAGVALLAGVSAAGAAVTDLACGRPASASSNTGAAADAVDCVGGTAWQSGRTKPQQLQVDLGSTVAVDHVTVVWGAGFGTSYKVRTSPDGASWHTVVQNTAGRGGTETLALPAGTRTRWVQLYLSQYAGSAGYAGAEPQPEPEHFPDGKPDTQPDTEPDTHGARPDRQRLHRRAADRRARRCPAG